MSLSISNDGIFKRAELVTLSGDTTVNSGGLRVMGAGNLIFRPADQDNFITWPVEAGEYIPGSIAEIKETGTTATGIYKLN